MANVAAPFGFSPTGTVAGGTPAFRQSRRLIASTNSTAIYKGDAVVPVTGTTTGYIIQATASTVALAGIFWGCEYLSTSQQKRIRSNYWPGSDANGDVIAYVIDDPTQVFLTQAGGTAIGLTKLNQNVQLNVGTGSTATGYSGMYVENPTTTSTLPFTIVGFQTDPPGALNVDITTGYNNLYVTFNNEIFRAGLTSVS